MNLECWTFTHKAAWKWTYYTKKIIIYTLHLTWSDLHSSCSYFSLSVSSLNPKKKHAVTMKASSKSMFLCLCVWIDSMIDLPTSFQMVGGVGGECRPRRSIAPSIQILYCCCFLLFHCCCCSVGLLQKLFYVSRKT